MKLSNKTAVVTGAASGIGKAIATAFAQEGADVAILDINLAKANEVAAAIQALGRKAIAISCDVGYAEQVNAAFTQAIQFLGGLDILVNNTGVIRFSKIVDMPEADWDFILRTNLKSVFLCSQQAARQMIQQQRGGRIISISSIHAVLSEPNCGHYTTAKGGIEAFSRTLATELAPHKITVNFIRPGATYTELTTADVHRLGETLAVRACAAEADCRSVLDCGRGGVHRQRRRPLHDRPVPYPGRRLRHGRLAAVGRVLQGVGRPQHGSLP